MKKTLPIVALAAVFTTINVSYASSYLARAETLDWFLSNTYPDFEAYPLSPPPDLSAPYLASIADKFANVSNVIAAEPYVPIPFTTIQSTGTSNVTVEARVEVAAIFSSHYAHLMVGWVEGDPSLGPEQALLPDSVARGLAISVGDRIRLLSDYQILNQSGAPTREVLDYEVAGVYVPQDGPIASLQRIYPWAFSRFSAPVILNLSVLPSSILVNSTAGVRTDIFVSRDSVVDALDTAGSLARLRGLRQRLFLTASEIGFLIRSQLEDAYNQFASDVGQIDLVISFSISPVVLVSLLIGALLEETEGSLRVRDFLIAKARGASTRLLARSVVIEAAFEAVLGSMLGLATAAAFVAAVPSLGALPLVGSSMVTSFVSFTVLYAIALASKVSVIRRLGRRSILTWNPASQGNLLQLRAESSPMVASFALGLGASFLITSLLIDVPLLPAPQSRQIVFGNLRHWFLILSLLAVVVAAAVYVPRASRRFVSRFVSESVAVQTRQVRRFVLAAAVNSRLVPDSSVLIVATIAISFSLMTPGLFSMQQVLVESAVYTETGSDIIMELPGLDNPPLNTLQQVPGISAISYASRSSADLGEYTTILLNTSAYMSVVRFEKLVQGDGLRRALARFPEPGTAVANFALALRAGLKPGSTFGGYVVTAVVTKMPGLQSPDQYALPPEDQEPLLFVDYASAGMTPAATSIARILVRLQPEESSSLVTRWLKALVPFATIRSAEAELRSWNAFPLVSQPLRIGRTAVWTSFFLLFVTLAASALGMKLRMQSQSAIMRVRGASSRVVRTLVLDSVLITVLLSAAWGISLGSALYTLALLIMIPGSLDLWLARPLPLDAPVVLLAVYLLLGLLFAATVGYRLSRITVRERLREGVD